MEEENLDLLDLDDDSSDMLPDVAPLSAPRPKKPWLLMGVGLAIIILATFVIIRTINSDNSSSMDIDLDSPAVVVDGDVEDLRPQPAPQPIPQPTPVQQQVQQQVQRPVQQPAPVAAPVVTPAPEPAAVMPVRVVEDRKNVTFNPDKTTTQPAPQPAAKPVAKPAAKPVAKTSANTWYAQLGSYSSRSLAESGERKLRAAHPALFAGQQTVILAAVLKNGTTTYRLRVSFNNQNDANGFCRNAKSDGVDCYVAK